MNYLVFRTKFNSLIKYSIVIVLLYIMYNSLNTHVSAQQVRSITISPPTINQIDSPGEKAEGTLKVINDSADPITFKVRVQDYVVEDDKGTPILLPPNQLSQKYSAAAWLGVAPDNFTVAPHTTQQLTYFLQVPINARPGGHYAAAVFVPINNASVDNGAAVQTEVGTLFYVTVRGPINEFAQVSKLEANGFQEYGPVAINAQIQNLGDLHIKPFGYINISNIFGAHVQTLTLPPYNIFPSAFRSYNFNFDGGFLFGRYKATLLATYGLNSNLPLSKTIYFWVIPWKIIVLTMLIIIIIFLGILVWRKKNHKNTAMEQVTEE